MKKKSQEEIEMKMFSMMDMFLPKLYFAFAEEGAGTGEAGAEEGAGAGSAAGAGAAGEGAGEAGGKGADEFTIPDTYKDNKWTEGLKSVDDVWKKLANAQGLVGKKALPPDFASMTENEITEYMTKSRPEKVDGYEFPEGTTDKQKEIIGKMLHDHGINAYQGNKLIDSYLKMGNEAQTEMFSKEGMETIFKESFGDNFKEDAGKAANFIKGNLTEVDQKLLEMVPNKYLGIFYRFANAVSKQYGATETGTGATGGEAGGGGNVEETRKKLREDIRALDKRPHTVDEKKVLNDKLLATYKTAKR